MKDIETDHLGIGYMCLQIWMASPRRGKTPAHAETNCTTPRDEAMDRMVGVMERIDRYEERREHVEEQQLRNDGDAIAGNEHHFTTFKNADPPKFAGDHDPMVAIEWIRQMEWVFSVVECSEDQKVRFASYMLKEMSSLGGPEPKESL